MIHTSGVGTKYVVYDRRSRRCDWRLVVIRRWRAEAELTATAHYGAVKAWAGDRERWRGFEVGIAEYVEDEIPASLPSRAVVPFVVDRVQRRAI